MSQNDLIAKALHQTTGELSGSGRVFRDQDAWELDHRWPAHDFRKLGRTVLSTFEQCVQLLKGLKTT